jgi:hypothetical protein
MLVYFMDTWSILRYFVIGILWTFGIVRVNFWYISPRFDILNQKNLATLGWTMSTPQCDQPDKLS